MKQSRYKLIKEYPDSEPAGTIFTWSPSWKLYMVGDRGNTVWTSMYFERWEGIYFEKI